VKDRSAPSIVTTAGLVPWLELNPHSDSDGTGTTSGHSVSQVQRPLKTPDEVRRLHEGMQIVFFRGLHPVLCLRVPYWIVFPSLPPFTLKQVLGTVGGVQLPTRLCISPTGESPVACLRPRSRPVWRADAALH